MGKEYEIKRCCSKCEKIESIFISKKEAAFDLIKINEVPGSFCENCLNNVFTRFLPTVHLDFELLKEWATDLNLQLMPQDEELFLADEIYLEMILEILDTIIIPYKKNNILIDALCIIIYDNSIDDNLQRDEKLKNRVIIELNKRLDKLIKADNWIMDYIKDVVYTQLKYDIRTQTNSDDQLL